MAGSPAAQADLGGIVAKPLEDFHSAFSMERNDESLIASGGDDTKVYRCVRKADGEVCATKVVPYYVDQDAARSAFNKERLFKEAKITQLCKAPNIVEFIDLFAGLAEIYMVFELVEGGDVFQEIQKRYEELPPDDTSSAVYAEKEASDRMREILKAVQVCHSNLVMHRDIKPENLLVTATGHFKLADFGLAHIAKEPGFYGFCGTPFYMAPELICSRERDGAQRTAYGHAVDVWACGVILFILLFGVQPFYDDNREILLRKIVEEDVKYPPEKYDLSPDAMELIRGMLNKDPAKRWTVDQALASPWFRPNARRSTLHRASTVKALRQFNASRKFRAGVDAILATRRVFKRGGFGLPAMPETGQAGPAGDTDDVVTAVTAANRRLIEAIVARDWETYTLLVDPGLTCFEPEAPGVLVEGLDFHKFYFDLPRPTGDAPAVPPKTTLVGERVTPLGAGSALQTYSRLTQAVSAAGVPYTMKSEETRVWRDAGGGRWVCVHFHRSGSPSAPNK